MTRVCLYLFGICAIRSLPISEEEAVERAKRWRLIYGELADVRQEDV